MRQNIKHQQTRKQTTYDAYVYICARILSTNEQENQTTYYQMRQHIKHQQTRKQTTYDTYVYICARISSTNAPENKPHMTHTFTYAPEY